MNSAEFSVFLATAKKLTTSGGVLKVYDANEVMEEILDVSVFSKILDVKKNEAEALTNF